MPEPTTEPSHPARRDAETPPRRTPLGAAPCEESEPEAKACQWCGADQ